MRQFPRVALLALVAGLAVPLVSPAVMAEPPAKTAGKTPVKTAADLPVHTYRVEDVLGFIRVGCIHNASYLGGLVGLIAALLWLRLSRRRWAQS